MKHDKHLVDAGRADAVGSSLSRRVGLPHLISARPVPACQVEPTDAPQRSLPADQPPLSTMNALLAGKLTGLLAPGGGERQLLATARELAEVGVRARLWRPWEEDLSGIDCVHLFGSEREHLTIVRAARRRKLPVVLSPVTWFDLPSCWREPWPLHRRAVACAKFLLRAAVPTMPSWRRRLYQAVDLLLPNSQAEADQLIRYFRIDPERIRIVPNGAERRFAMADPEPFAAKVGCRDFILYVGRIEPRKNQLGFLRAMQGVVVPIVVLGDAVPGHEDYFDACRRAAGTNVRFVPGIAHDDVLLASAYAACGCLVLASWYETPGLVAIEAAMSGTPLVLPRGGCAREYFGELAAYVSPGDLPGIQRAVLDALAAGRSPQLASLVREHFTWRTAAWATKEAYEQVV